MATMTEKQWGISTEIRDMVAFLGDRVTDRKMRLFASACCRLLYVVHGHQRRLAALDSVERYADGLISFADLKTELQPTLLAAKQKGAGKEERLADKAIVQAARKTLLRSYDDITEAVPAWETAVESAVWSEIKDDWGDHNPFYQLAEWRADDYEAAGVDDYLVEEEADDLARQLRKPVNKAQVAVLREIVGNPFKPAQVDWTWKRGKGKVLELARAIYDERRFDQMPSLGEALEKAGCKNEDVLVHCAPQRQEPPGSTFRHFRGCWVIDALIGKS